MAPMSCPVSRTSAIGVLRLREFSYSTLARWLKADESAFSVRSGRAFALRDGIGAPTLAGRTRLTRLFNLIKFVL